MGKSTAGFKNSTKVSNCEKSHVHLWYYQPKKYTKIKEHFLKLCHTLRFKYQAHLGSISGAMKVKVYDISFQEPKWTCLLEVYCDNDLMLVTVVPCFHEALYTKQQQQQQCNLLI